MLKVHLWNKHASQLISLMHQLTSTVKLFMYVPCIFPKIFVFTCVGYFVLNILCHIIMMICCASVQACTLLLLWQHAQQLMLLLCYHAQYKLLQLLCILSQHAQQQQLLLLLLPQIYLQMDCNSHRERGCCPKIICKWTVMQSERGTGGGEAGREKVPVELQWSEDKSLFWVKFLRREMMTKLELKKLSADVFKRKWQYLIVDELH